MPSLPSFSSLADLCSDALHRPYSAMMHISAHNINSINPMQHCCTSHSTSRVSGSAGSARSSRVNNSLASLIIFITMVLLSNHLVMSCESASACTLSDANNHGVNHAMLVVLKCEQQYELNSTHCSVNCANGVVLLWPREVAAEPLVSKLPSRIAIPQSTHLSAPPTNSWANNEADLRADLIAVFIATQGSTSWLGNATANWLSNSSICTWAGITCESTVQNGLVNITSVGIDFTGVNLNGALPTSFLGSFGGRLQNLTLRSNLQLTGALAPLNATFASKWPKLRLLDVALTGISGNYLQIANSTELRSLDLSISQWGDASSKLSQLVGLQQLQSLRLQVMPGFHTIDTLVAETLQLWPNLEILDLTDYGANIDPRILDTYCASLVEIYWSLNSFQGSLPTLRNCSNLRVFDLSNPRTSVGQSLWTDWDPLVNLKVLNLAFHSSLNGSGNWSGISALRQLQVLDLSLVPINTCSKTNLPTPDSANDLLPLLSMTALQNVTLLQCGLCGTLFPLPHTNLSEVTLSRNPGIVGPIPEQFVSASAKSLTVLRLASCSLDGMLPSDLLTASIIDECDLSNNKINGTLISNCEQNATTTDVIPNVYPGFSLLDLSINQFSGTIPICLGAIKLDLSNNQFFGQLSSTDYTEHSSAGWWDQRNRTFHVQSINVANNHLSCDDSNAQLIDLAGSPMLTEINLANNQFHCDLGSVLKQTPDTVRSFVASNNSWAHSYKHSSDIWPRDLTHLFVNDCNITSLPDNRGAHQRTLETLNLNDNPMSDVTEFHVLTFLSSLQIRNLYISGCSLSSPINFMAGILSQQQLLETIDLSNNKLHGPLPELLFAADETSTPTALPLTISQVHLENNPGITGHLPQASPNYAAFALLDLSGSQIISRIPESWSEFSGLAFLGLQGLQHPQVDVDALDDGNPCSLVNLLDGDGSKCFLPSWIKLEQYVAVLGSPSVECPQLQIAAHAPNSLIQLNVHDFAPALCRCSEGYFGTLGICTQCFTDGGCDRLQVNGTQTILNGYFPDPAYLPTPAQVDDPRTYPNVTFLPCPLAQNGQVLCNPNNVTWPYFQSEWVGKADDPSILDSFCRIGHTGRLCSRCSDDYFSAGGRACTHCPSIGWSYMIFIGQMFLVLAFAAIVHFLITPRHASAPAELLLLGSPWFENFKLRQIVPKDRVRPPAPPKSPIHEPEPEEDADSDQIPVSATSIDRNDSTRIGNEAAVDVIVPSSSFVGNRASLPSASVINRDHSAVDWDLMRGEAALSPSPSQLESSHSFASSPYLNANALVRRQSQYRTDHTGRTLPETKDVPASFAMALEAIRQETPNPWRLLVTHVQQMSIILSAQTALPLFQTLLSVFSASASIPSGVFMALECVFRPFTLSHMAIVTIVPAVVLLIATLSVWIAGKCACSAAFYETHAPRLYGTLITLAYSAAFPVAQVSFSLLACTDTRSSGRVFLNLYPYQECDSEWHRTVLPFAAMGAISCVGFALASLFLLPIAHRRLKRGDGRLWPILAELVRPYQLAFWYWEQVVLWRRLAFAAIISFFPAAEVSVLVLLFLLILIATSLEHFFRPYSNRWMHVAELTSLYLLLATYFIAVLLHRVGANTEVLASEAWLGALLIINIIFVIILIVSLISWVRNQERRIVKGILSALRTLYELALSVSASCCCAYCRREEQDDQDEADAEAVRNIIAESDAVKEIDNKAVRSSITSDVANHVHYHRMDELKEPLL